MFILFGERPTVRTRDTGEFYCQQCDGWREYAYQIQEMQLTLFFIRTGMSTRTFGEFVQCRGCGGQFDPVALRYNPGRPRPRMRCTDENGMV
jgi:hypothetical protein